MSSEFQKPSTQETSGRITEEYRVLHKVAQTLQNPGELNDIFPNSPEDSAIVYANATFNMENASGLVKVVGSYLTMSDTLGIQINSTGASFVEIIPPYPSTIAVQGSPDLESTIITAEIRDGNGNLVSDSYITRFTLAAPAAIAGVHFNGEAGLTDTYTYSSNGSSSITLNSGQIPVSVAITVEVYEMADIASVEALDDLDIITEATVTRVVLSDGKATGVEIRNGGTLEPTLKTRMGICLK